MPIENVRAVPGVSGFYTDDQRAIKAGADRDGFTYTGDPVTPGFDRVREPGEALVVELDLADGTTVRGDCCAVQYSGAGGRDPLFRAAEYHDAVTDEIGNQLVGRDATDLADTLAVLDDDHHTAVRYGVSQALLAAAARARRTTRTDVLADHLGTTPATEPVPVFGQSGDRRRQNAEKMLVKGVPVLPHGLFNDREKVGSEGEGLREYLAWLSERTREIGREDYHPRFHVDVYGVLGDVFGPPYDRDEVVEYFRSLQVAAAPYPLQVEGPMDDGDGVDDPGEARERQIRAMTELRDGLCEGGVDVDIVADEWCNTLDDVRAFVDAGAADVVQVKTPDLGGIQRSGEAVRYCEGTDVRAYLGGTCNETATSAAACAHVALATDAAQVLAKPGMGFDEGYMVVTNEMRRTVARRADRTGGSRAAAPNEGVSR
jgi:methylaspartate ammonia-lyase